MFRVQVADSNVEKPVRYGAGYDYEDLRTMSKGMGDAVVASDFLSGQSKKPTFVVYGIENRTEQHIDTKALTDGMRQAIMDSGKVNFVNETQRDNLLREQIYQAAHVTADTRARVGRQLGANYMLTGSLVEINKQSGRQVRVSKQEEVYLQLTVEITDLETSLIVWSKQKERARTENKPLIGW